MASDNYLKAFLAKAKKHLPDWMHKQVHMSARGSAGGMSKKKPMKIQTLIFDKGKFSDEQAKSWAKAHNFDYGGVDETGGSYRLRQKNPSQFKTFRTIELKPGVKAVVAKGDDNASGLKIDLGSGAQREPGHVGVDLYPHDAATVVHDVALGLPFPDGCASQVRLVDALESMGVDPHELLAEIQRVLQPGGHLVYQGANTIDPPSHMVDISDIDKAEGVNQQFVKVVNPDPATAQDAEPRMGIPNWDDIPSDTMLAMDAMGYYWSDATTSGRGNRMHGYPSQGAVSDRESVQLAKDALSTESREHIADTNFALPKERKYPIHDISHARNALARVAQHGTADEQAKVRAAVYRQYPSLKPVKKSGPRKIAKVAIIHKGKLLMGRRRDNGKWTLPGGHVEADESMIQGALREVMEETGIGLNEGQVEAMKSSDHNDADGNPLHVQAYKAEMAEKPSTSMLDDPDGEVERWRWIDMDGGLPEHIHNNLHVPAEKDVVMHSLSIAEPKHHPIVKMDGTKQIVYGVVLEPDEEDSQGDIMSAKDIEDAAHKYLSDSRVIGSRHSKAIKAHPVESYIAPQDFETDGQYGKQVVKKGSWILGVKVVDPQEWAKIESGDYQGFSVGGFGQRRELG